MAGRAVGCLLQISRNFRSGVGRVQVFPRHCGGSCHLDALNRLLKKHPGGEFADFSPKVLENWIGRLPLADVEAAGVALLEQLRRLNMEEGLGCKERMRIVEQLRSACVSLVAMTSEKYLPAAALFPLSKDVREHVRRGMEIGMELAYAYRRIVTNGEFFSDVVMDPDGQARVVCRALQAYGLALSRSLESYESPPPGFWRDVYGFYVLAGGHGLLTISLLDNDQRATSVDSVFKQILLLALSSHKHLQPDEIRQCRTALMLIAADAQIHSGPQLGDETARFCFNLGSDRPPLDIRRTRRLDRSQTRFIYTASMIDNARHYFANPIHRPTKRFKIRLQVVQRLLKSLDTGEKRPHMRMSAVGIPCRFSLGLAGVLAEPYWKEDAARREQPFPSLAGGPQEDAEEETLREEIEKLGVLLDRASRSHNDSFWDHEESVEFQEKSNIDEIQAEGAAACASGMDGFLISASVQYCCILWKKREAPGVRVGELIGFQGEGRPLQVGVVRWLHQREQAGLVLGVELFCPVAVVVGIGEGQEAESRQGLYFADSAKLQRPASLLTGRLPLRIGQNIVLNSQGNRRSCHLEDLLEATFDFHLFRLGGVQQPQDSSQHLGESTV